MSGEGNDPKLLLLCYVSKACDPFDAARLRDLVGRSAEKNSKIGVTGLLLYSDGSFLQLLEGEERTVLDLFDTISKDPRHRQVLKVFARLEPERIFGTWSMAGRIVSASEGAALGLGSVLTHDGTLVGQDSLPSWVHRLAREFAEINR